MDCVLLLPYTLGTLPGWEGVCCENFPGKWMEVVGGQSIRVAFCCSPVLFLHLDKWGK